MPLVFVGGTAKATPDADRRRLAKAGANLIVVFHATGGLVSSLPWLSPLPPSVRLLQQQHTPLGAIRRTFKRMESVAVVGDVS